MLYYDGMSIHCMSATGAVRWSFQLGTNAGFDCDGEHIALTRRGFLVSNAVIAELM